MRLREQWPSRINTCRMFDPCKNVKRYQWRNLITDVFRGFSKLRLRGYTFPTKLW